MAETSTSELTDAFARLGLGDEGGCNRSGMLKVVGYTQSAKRHFSLLNNVLYCYKHKEDYKPEEILTVSDVRDSKTKPEGFEIISEKRCFLLEAPNDDERTEWMKSLKQASKLTITDFYDIKKTLGTGNFSKVKLGIHKASGVQVAVKIIDRKVFNKNKDAMLTEIAILQRTNHPNIVKLISVFHSPKAVYLIFELLTGGELFERIVEQGSYTEQDTALLMAKVVSAISYAHDLGIVHRDLKPENLLYSSPDPDADIKIGDFGLGKLASENDVMSTPCGTPGYVAPEVLTMQGYDKSVDMWSAGVIMYILLCGFPPFFADTDPELFEKIKAGFSPDTGFPSPYWDGISSSAKDLITGLLQKDRAQRLTAHQALAHPWIRGDAVYKKGELPQAIARIRKMVAKRRFKKGVLATIAVNRFKFALAGAASSKK